MSINWTLLTASLESHARQVMFSEASLPSTTIFLTGLAPFLSGFITVCSMYLLGCILPPNLYSSG